MNRFHLKACAKCQGDLVLDEGDWLCLQCGTYYYIGLYRKQSLFQQPQQRAAPPRLEKGLGVFDQTFPCHSEPFNYVQDKLREESGEVESNPRSDSSSAPLPRNHMAQVWFESPSRDQLAVGTLVEQVFSPPPVHRPEFPLTTKINVSTEFQFSVSNSITLKS